MDVEKRNAKKPMIDLYAGVCLPKCEAVGPNAWTVSSVSHMMCKFVNDHRYFRRLTSLPHVMFRSVGLRWEAKVLCTKPNFPGLVDASVFVGINGHANDVLILLFHAPFGIEHHVDRAHIVGAAHGIDEALNILNVVDLGPPPLIHPFAYLVKHSGVFITSSI